MAKKEVTKLYVQTQGNEASVFLYGIIGDTSNEPDKCITDLVFIKTLDALHTQGITEVHLRINSPGGFTSDGLAIITAIKNSPLKIHTWNDGRCFSMAADIWLCVPVANRHMAKNSSLMIHAPSAGCYGTAKDMREMADQLDTIAEATIVMMSDAIQKTAEDIRKEFYDYADHNLTYQQCLDLGLFVEDSGEEYESETAMNQIESMKIHFLKYAAQKFAQITELIEEPILDKIENNKDAMNAEALKTAIAEGKISLAEVEKIATDEKAKQPLSITEVSKLVQDAVSPLRAENDALKLDIEALKTRTFGNPPSAPAAANLAEAANDPVMKIEDLRETLNGKLKGRTFSGDDI